MKKCLLIANVSDTVYLFLRPLIRVLREFKYNIVIISGNGKYFYEILKIADEAICFEFKNIDYRYFLNLYSKIKIIKPDLVIANDPIAAFMGRIISRIAGVEKVVYYCHGLPFASHSNLFEKVAYLSLEIFASFFTKYNIVMNNYDYSILKSLNRNTFFNHGVGVDPATIQKKMSNENKNDKKNIIFIARLVKKKGIYEYIDIARNSEGPKYNFYIYGDGNIKIKNRIQQLISKEKNIFYSGYKNNINEAFNNADIFLFPSRYTEGLPRVIMESMIFGVPVIASNIRGNKDIIINGYNGFLFKFKHDYIKNIYSIIETLNSNDAERDRIIENAKKTIYDKYTIIKIMDEYRYIIHKIEQN